MSERGTDKYAHLTRHVPSNSPAVREAAARAVTRLARDEDDAALLLDALGLTGGR